MVVKNQLKGQTFNEIYPYLYEEKWEGKPLPDLLCFAKF